MPMRYAIYYVPPSGTPLADLGARVLGYDADKGMACPRLAVPGIDEARLVQATHRATRYGFHATLKAPFRLAAGCSRSDVLKLAADTADHCHPVVLSGLEIATLGTFVAFRPQQQLAALDVLAAAFVRDMDCLRTKAPRDEARWPRGSLSPRQEQLLDAWGYPYVLDEYRFHMTLTDALAPGETETFAAALRAAAVHVTGMGITIDSVAVMEESGPTQPFQVIARMSLRGARPYAVQLGSSR